jgi:hypothetical protein
LPLTSNGRTKKLCKEELHNLLVDKIKALKMGGTWEIKNACNNLTRKFEERKSRGRPRSRWEDNIKVTLRGMGQGLECTG